MKIHCRHSKYYDNNNLFSKNIAVSRNCVCDKKSILYRSNLNIDTNAIIWTKCLFLLKLNLYLLNKAALFDCPRWIDMVKSVFTWFCHLFELERTLIIIEKKCTSAWGKYMNCDSLQVLLVATVNISAVTLFFSSILSNRFNSLWITTNLICLCRNRSGPVILR